MVPKKIYLIRHGQTEYNKQGIVQGCGVDSSLNDTGRAQAQAFYTHFKDTPPDQLFISGLKRTRETMASFIDAGVPYESLPGLNEIHWGTKEGKPFNPDDHDEYLHIVNAWRMGETHLGIAGGQSPEEVAAQQKECLPTILEAPGKEVFVCMHGRAMRIFLCVMLNLPLRHMDLFEHSNLSCYRLTHTGSMFSLDWYNYRRHLED